MEDQKFFTMLGKVLRTLPHFQQPLLLRSLKKCGLKFTTCYIKLLGKVNKGKGGNIQQEWVATFTGICSN